jgi:PST family polysaccharide transporter
MNAVGGGALNFAKIAIQFLLIPVMARLLGPAEFGLYALALPTIAFFTVIADGGLGVSLAREDEGQTRVWSTAFWVLLATSLVLCLVVIGWGAILSVLARAPRLFPIMTLLSLSFVFIAVSVLPTARLTRSGNLVLYAVADFIANALGAVAAVSLAIAGAGAMSLAVQYVTSFATRALILNLVAFYRPRRQFHLGDLGGHLLTGGFLLGGRLLEFSSRLVENVLFGRAFGAAALGTYTFANQVPRFICEAASNPTWSALYSHALRDESRDLGPAYRKICRFLASMTFPVAGLLSASAPSALVLLLGQKWAPAAPLIQILVPSYALGVVASQGSAILLSKGRNATFLVILAGLTAGRLLAVCSGYWLGETAVAWGIVVANVLYAIAMVIAPARLMDATPWDLLRVLVGPTVSSVVAAAVCAVAIAMEPHGPIATVVGLALGGVAYLVAMVAMEGALLKADLLTLRRVVFRRAAFD